MAISLPTDISNCTEWKSAKDTSTITVDGSNNVTAFNDKVDSGKHLTNITGTPKSGTRTHNGHNVVDLDGASSIRGGSTSASAPHTIAVCFVADDHSASGEHMVWGGWRTFRAGIGTASGKWFGETGESSGNRPNAASGWHTFIVVYATGAQKWYIDGVDVSPSGMSGTPQGTTMVVGGEGSLSTGAPDTNFFDGAFCEGVRYTKALSGAEALDLHNYFVANWAAAGKPHYYRAQERAAA